MEHGSLGRNVANSLRGIKLLRCMYVHVSYIDRPIRSLRFEITERCMKPAKDHK